MIRKSMLLTVLAYIAIALVSFSPKPAHAGGFMTTLCWGGDHGTGASPTVGCTVFWRPGGVGIYGFFVGSYPICTPNCVVNPNNGAWAASFDMVRVPSGNINKHLAGNCVGQTITVRIDSISESTRPTGSTRGGPLQTVQKHYRGTQGPVGQSC